MERVVLYVGLTEEENKELNSNEIANTLTKRVTELMDYAESNNYEIVGVYRDGFYIGDSDNRINLNKMLDDLNNKSATMVLTTYNEVISNVKEKMDKFLSLIEKAKVKFNAILKLNSNDTVSSRRNNQLKELINECELEYVSPSIINLLKLDIKNDESFLDPNCEVKKRASYVREIYNSEYNWYGKSVILYVRLSDEDKNKKSEIELSESIKNQISMLLKHAKANRWVVVAIFCDEDYSGIDSERPEYNKCLRFCEVGRTDIVLCKMQSRFTRDMEHVEKYIHGLFLEWGIRFVGKVDNADTVVKGNKKSRQINGLINEWYLEELSENIRDTFRDKHVDGQFTGSFAPYGYMKDPNDKNHLIIDPVASVVVKKIFDLYINKGYGYIAIIKYLKEHNIPSPYEYKISLGMNVKYTKESKENVWGRSTIARILHNIVYKGDLAQSRTTTANYKSKKVISLPKEQWIVCKHTHEPIIDIETWNKAQEITKKKNRGCRKSGIKHKYSGMIECDCCHKNFKKTSSDSKRPNVEYFQCTQTSYPYHECNNKKLIRVDVLDDFICEQINKRIQKYKNLSIMETVNLEKMVNDDNDQKIKSLEIEKKDIEKQISEKDRINLELYEDLKKGILEIEEYRTFKESIKNDKNNLTNRLEVIKDELDEYNNSANKFQEASKVYQKYDSIKEITKAIIDEFIERIYVGNYKEETNSRDIKIKWKYQF